jgi:hypothetical protein
MRMGAELAMDPRRWMRTGIAVVLAVKLAGLLPLAAVAVGAGEGGVRSSSGAAAARTATPGTAPAAPGSSSTTSKPPPPMREPEPLRIPGDGPSAEFDAESRGVRELVEVLRRRDEELARRDAELARREAAIAAATKDLNDKIVHLETLTGSTPPAGVPAEGLARAGAAAVPGSAVGETGGGGDARGAGGRDGASGPVAAVDSMEELGKIYGAMKAEEAAPLFDRLDDVTVLRIFQHMKQRQISAVLPLMKPEKAVTLTELLGGRRPAPPAARAAAATPATPAATR